MRIAVVTITRDRLEYTKRAFAGLYAKAGAPFVHIVIDNGSRDGTDEWLYDFLGHRLGDDAGLLENDENEGISRAWNDACALATAYRPDLVVKVDNDCEVLSDDILAQLAGVMGLLKAQGERWVLSPRVEGIDRQPGRARRFRVGTHEVGETSIVGGLFRVMPVSIAKEYRDPEDLPLAKGQDGALSRWCVEHGVRMGYVEDLVVRHMDTTAGQAERFPEYFARKRREEQA